ncbi:hypothetical protein [Nocardia brasiliensis]|uniref:hypothetical protein n=1 Tax=Nocardia brasiliensis TaxID=37326 RepID=UPI002454F579|nr:hypothetical protein [Nocardia brasiliensis]
MNISTLGAYPSSSEKGTEQNSQEFYADKANMPEAERAYRDELRQSVAAASVGNIGLYCTTIVDYDDADEIAQTFKERHKDAPADSFISRNPEYLNAMKGKPNAGWGEYGEVTFLAGPYIAESHFIQMQLMEGDDQLNEAVLFTPAKDKQGNEIVGKTVMTYGFTHESLRDSADRPGSKLMTATTLPDELAAEIKKGIQKDPGFIREIVHDQVRSQGLEEQWDRGPSGLKPRMVVNFGDVQNTKQLNIFTGLDDKNPTLVPLNKSHEWRPIASHEGASIEGEPLTPEAARAEYYSKILAWRNEGATTAKVIERLEADSDELDKIGAKLDTPMNQVNDVVTRLNAIGALIKEFRADLGKDESRDSVVETPHETQVENTSGEDARSPQEELTERELKEQRASLEEFRLQGNPDQARIVDATLARYESASEHTFDIEATVNPAAYRAAIARRDAAATVFEEIHGPPYVSAEDTALENIRKNLQDKVSGQAAHEDDPTLAGRARLVEILIGGEDNEADAKASDRPQAYADQTLSAKRRLIQIIEDRLSFPDTTREEITETLRGISQAYETLGDKYYNDLSDEEVYAIGGVHYAAEELLRYYTS